MGTAQDANIVAILASGANPRWYEQTSLDTAQVPPSLDTTGTTGAPASGAAGEPLPTEGGVGSLRALVAVDLRVMAKPHEGSDQTEAHHRTARIVIDSATFDTAGEYTLSVDGQSVTTSAGPYADVEAATQAWVSAINGSPAVAAIVAATAVDADGDGAYDTLLIQGIGEDDYRIDVVSTSGTGAVSCRADAAEAKLRIWTTEGGVASGRQPGWRVPADGVRLVDRRGLVERLDVAGQGRVYLEVYDVLGVLGDASNVDLAYRAWIGPAIRVGEQ